MEKALRVLEKFYLSEVITITIIFFTGFMFLVAEMRRVESKIDQQGARTDRLYEMFINLLKEKK